MPIFMDVHVVPGVRASDVAEAHYKDLIHQAEHGCKCMTYWIDEKRESIFCLVEAPDKGSVEEMHRQSHGLIPSKIIEVDSSLVESFLGRIYDPEEVEINEKGLKVFADSGFRTLMVVTHTDPVLLRHQLGIEKADAQLQQFYQAVRKNITAFQGREAEHDKTGFIISFASASNAVSCALSVQKELHAAGIDAPSFQMGINAGEPVSGSNRMFGDTIQTAHRFCAIAEDNQVIISSVVRDLIEKDFFDESRRRLVSLSPQDEALLTLLFGKLEEKWPDAEFDMENYCQETAMSKSQLYRKTISLTGVSPNILLKDFRLGKAKELMKQQRYNIAQITFDSGFTSASYFTKCFKKKYGLLPMAYLDLMH